MFRFPRGGIENLLGEKQPCCFHSRQLISQSCDKARVQILGVLGSYLIIALTGSKLYALEAQAVWAPCRITGNKVTSSARSCRRAVRARDFASRVSPTMLPTFPAVQ